MVKTSTTTKENVAKGKAWLEKQDTPIEAQVFANPLPVTPRGLVTQAGEAVTGLTASKTLGKGLGR